MKHVINTFCFVVFFNSHKTPSVPASITATVNSLFFGGWVRATLDLGTVWKFDCVRVCRSRGSPWTRNDRRMTVGIRRSWVVCRVESWSGAGSCDNGRGRHCSWRCGVPYAAGWCFWVQRLWVGKAFPRQNFQPEKRHNLMPADDIN